MNKSKHHHRILVDLIRKKRWHYLGSVVAVSIASYFMFLVPTIGKVVIDRVITDPPVTDDGFLNRLIDWAGGATTLSTHLWMAGIAIVITTALAGAFMYLKDYFAARACEDTVKDLRERLFAHLHRLSETYLNRADSGDIVQRCTSDMDTLRQFLTLQVMDMGRTVVLMCIVVPLMFMTSPVMATVSLFMLPLVFIYAWIYFGRIKGLFQEVDEAEGELTTIVQENLTGIRVVRAFSRQDYECEKFEHGNARYRDLNFRLIRMLSNFWASSDLLCLTQNGFVLIGGGYLASRGVITVGTFFAFIGYANMLIWPIRQLGQQLSEAGKATVAIGRIQEILDAPEEPVSRDEVELPAGASADIVFDGITFGFDPEKPVLRDVSFQISAGETIAIVGPTGAGKSTLIQLLMRLHDYTTGSIRLGGFELNSLSRQSVRRSIGTLLQEPFLFSRSLRDNIKFGRSSASDEHMVRSTTDAAVHHTIEAFQDKYETVIGERGVSLSGGQKQRVTLSRTLLRNAPVLVLDDTLSAVDSNTERQILKALDRKRGEQTLLIITHRISVCRQADRVFVIQDGRLSAQGTHEQLQKQPGFYQQLWNIQSGQKAQFEADAKEDSTGLSARVPAG